MMPERLDQLRHAWFRHLAGEAFEPSWTSQFGALAQLPPISRFTVVLMVGLGHLLGIDDRDLAVDGVLTEEEVEALIIQAWRQGGLGPDFAAWLLPSLVSTRWAANRYEQFDASPAGKWVESSHFGSRCSALSAAWASPPDYLQQITVASASAPNRVSLDQLSQWLHITYPDDNVLFWFTPLEARLLGPDPQRDAARERLEAARSEMYIWLLMPGAWPNRPNGTTPPWFRDVVTIEGARLWHSSCGYVPTLSVVVETDRDERSLLPWSYEPTLAARFPDDDSVELFIVLDADDDPAYLPFYFSYDNHRSSQQLDVMLSVGFVRIEFYRLQADGHLRHLWNFGIPFVSLDELQDHRDRWAGMSQSPFDVAPSPTELLTMIDQRQRALFESTLPSLDVRSGDPRVAAAWERQLQVLDDAARSHATGRIIDERILTEAATEVRAAEASVHRSINDPDGSRIQQGEALLHVSIKEDTGWFSSAVVCRRPDGSLHGIPVALDYVDMDSIDAITSLTDALVLLLEPLRELFTDGICDLVISAGLGAYSLPLHEAALRLGFRSATYLHSVRLLHRVPEVAPGAPPLIFGHPGEGPEYIAAADAELNIVASLTSGLRASADWRGEWPSVVHVAGHGIAGAREHESGILLADGDFLSAPAILRDVDAQETQIAFLSACSSGAGKFEIGRAAHAVPLDVALLEKGCRTAISTSAPVNDHVALIFAAAFHHAVADGANAWDGYMAARACFATRRPQLPQDLQDLLDSEYPRWRTPLPPDAGEDWTLFRYSGDR